MLHGRNAMSHDNILMNFPTESMRVINLHSVACWVYSFINSIPDSGIIFFSFYFPLMNTMKINNTPYVHQ